ncbi:MAG: hypothetical protein A4S12_04975 [Proteobacteria bacterium SG_bin5]|nr:outer membrane beta-barrel protein [Sphingomonas sp.]OQW43439.1 MAG: hypothetical protein A4S12_04975 [Proteobacteria bacterium SG_bin5]
MRFVSLAALVAGLSAAPAFAQDAPAPDRVFDGPRAGVILGYDRLQPGSSEDSDIAGDDEGADGLLYGGDIGYDVQRGRLVFGVEAEITGSTSRVGNPARANLGFGRVKAGRDIYGGVRIGTTLTPTTLAYAKAGYTNARLDLTASDGVTETGGNFNLDGYRVGLGLEKALGPRTYAKIEYRYSNYGDARFEFPRGGNTNNFGIDTDRHQLAAGVGFRF